MTVEERRKAGKVFVNLWGKVVGVQGAKPHARAMTKTLKSKTKKNKKIADQKNPCYARAAARRDDLLTEKKEAIRKQTHFLIAFFFFRVTCHLTGKSALTHRSGTLGNPSLGFPTPKHSPGIFRLPS